MKEQRTCRQCGSVFADLPALQSHIFLDHDMDSYPYPDNCEADRPINQLVNEGVHVAKVPNSSEPTKDGGVMNNKTTESDESAKLSNGMKSIVACIILHKSC